MSHVAIDFEYWLRELVRFAMQTPIGIALVVVLAIMAVGFRSRFNFLRRRDYSDSADELRTFDERAALDEWKRDNGQNS